MKTPLAALIVAGLLWAPSHAATRFEKVSDRFAMTLAPSHPVDLPWSRGAWNAIATGGLDLRPNKSGIWAPQEARKVEGLASFSIAQALNERIFLREHFGGAGKPEAYVFGGQVGVHLLRGIFDSASLQFSIGPAGGYFDHNLYFVVQGSGAWSMELFRIKTEARSKDVLRGGVLLGLDIGFLAHDGHAQGSLGFTPLRISGGIFVGHGWRRYLMILEGTQDGRFRLLFGFGGFRSVAPMSYPDYTKNKQH
jgi:hypothetical protein